MATPIDYIASFDLERNDEDDVVWRRFVDYLDRLKRAASAEASKASGGALSDVIRKVPPADHGGRL